MSFTPAVLPFTAQQQGNQNFPYPASWIDIVQSSSTATAYNLTTMRSNAGLVAGQPVFVIFSADGPFWVNFNNTAVIPVANKTDGSGSEFSPNQRYLDKTITTISIVSAANVNVSMQFSRP